MRCDQCQYWDKEYIDWASKETNFGKCTAVQERWEIENQATLTFKEQGFERPRDWEKYLSLEREALKAARAYVQDGSEYRAELVTGPDFFCALFDAK